MMLASYFTGRVIYPIDYEVRRVVFYIVAAMALWGAGWLLTTGENLFDLPLRVLLLAVYAGLVFMTERRGAFGILLRSSKSAAR